MSCYIQQDDRLQTLLTTWENMKIAADLKLGVDVKTSAKEEIVRFVCLQTPLIRQYKSSSLLLFVTDNKNSQNDRFIRCKMDKSREIIRGAKKKIVHRFRTH